MIKRYFATKDNTITNAFEENLSTRATGSNMGASDILEVFSIYGQSTETSSELSRVLLQFDTTEMSTDRDNSTIPASGSVTWYLKMYDAAHSKTVPRDYALLVNMVSASWEEGYGLDMDNYQDLTNDGTGSNWINAVGAAVSASMTVTAASKTAGQANTRVLTIADIAGNSVNFSIDNSISTSTATKIAFGNANSNANFFAAHITGAVNLAQAAGTLNVTASRAGAVVTLKQTSTGLGGNAVAVPSGTAVSDSVVSVSGDFTGGDGEWAAQGGDYHTAEASTQIEKTFATGLEDLEVDVTAIVEQWLRSSSPKSNYGFGIRLTDAYESTPRSYYTKKLFGRETEYWFKQPTLEARWDDIRRDDRGDFFLSSSLAPAEDNQNTIFLYNYVRGRLRNIPAVGTNNTIYVSLFSGSENNTEPMGDALTLTNLSDVDAGHVTVITGSYVSTGIYKATIAHTGSSLLTKVYDVWSSSWDAVGGTQYFTGSININTLSASAFTQDQDYTLSMPNLSSQYRFGETPKLRLYVREKNWSPNVYNVAVQSSIPSTLISSASYQIKRTVDDEIVIPYGTGSLYYTGLSYDISGNYFKLDTGMLEKGYQYEIYYSFYNEDSANYVEQPYKFKFRVAEE
tara:strand:+ start:577 stop:2457 length:1881 start_codon:yes stop_codon:yes gene_type:complete